MMTEIRWETRRRYYAARVYRDLLGDWIVECSWGGLRDKPRHIERRAAASYLDAVDALAQIHAQRLAEHYAITTSH